MKRINQIRQRQDEIIRQTDEISQRYYSLMATLKGDKREYVKNAWLVELEILRQEYNSLREQL